jgi:hypothetical protein
MPAMPHVTWSPTIAPFDCAEGFGGEPLAHKRATTHNFSELTKNCTFPSRIKKHGTRLFLGNDHRLRLGLQPANDGDWIWRRQVVDVLHSTIFATLAIGVPAFSIRN